MIIMKNLVKIYSALVAALCLISCNEKIGSELLEPGEYITVSTYVSPHTKAGYEGTSVLPETFNISIDQTGTDKDYERTMTRVEGSNKYVFPNNEKLKWASSDYSTVNIRAITTSAAYDGSTVTIGTDQSSDAKVLENDILGAQTGNGIEISSGNVVVHFNHLLSKLYVRYNTSNVTVSSIKVNGIGTKGSYNPVNRTYSDPTAFENITMYHNATEATAEAIFFPGAPGNNLTLSVSISGNSNPLTVPISLDKVGGTFLPGKRYIMNVTITNSRIDGAEVTVSDWIPDNTTITTEGEKVLWVGTSIPAGNQLLNYPAEVDRAMTCEITNVAVGGSLVCKQINTDWITAAHYTAYDESMALVMKLMGGGLSQTKQEIREFYYNKLMSVSNDDSDWANEVIAEMQSLSYESLIIPYIDGTKGNCTTVILDHGFNDLSNMIYIAGVFRTPGEIVRGYECMRQLRDGEMTIEEFEQAIKDNPNNVSLDASYIHAMSKIIKAIQNKAAEIGTDIRIIIGNYFSLYSPYVAHQYKVQHESEYLYDLSVVNGEYRLTYRKEGRENVTNPAFGQFEDYATFSNLLCYYNEAIAGMHKLDIVNVYEHISIPESMFWGGTQNYTVAVYTNNDDNKPVFDHYDTVLDPDGNPVDFDASFNPIVRYDPGKFCPDGVHPSNPAAVGAIAEIYIRELDGVIGSKN